MSKKKCETRMGVFCAHSAHGIITILHNTIGKAGKQIILEEVLWMKSTLELGAEKKKYFLPTVEVFVFDSNILLSLSTEEKNDNEFDAGGMGNF